MFFHDHIEIDAPQARAIARGLYTLAAVDGVHPSELALILAFFSDAAGEGEELTTISPAELAALVTDEDQRLLFVKTALLVAHVHQKVSAAEEEVLDAFVKALGVGDLEMLALEFSLIRQLERSVPPTA